MKFSDFGCQASRQPEKYPKDVKLSDIDCRIPAAGD
jgi:hypothetical protein